MSEDKVIPEDSANDLAQLRKRRQVVDGRCNGIRDILGPLREANSNLEDLRVEEQGDEDAQNDEERERAAEIIGVLERMADLIGVAITIGEDALMTADVEPC